VTQHGARHLREEAFDEIEPGAVLRCEDDGEAPFGLGGEPSCGFLGNVGRVIDEDELDRGCRRIGGVERSQEGDELARTCLSLVPPGLRRSKISMPASRLNAPCRTYSGSGSEIAGGSGPLPVEALLSPN
jgi:hypothetical protein